MPWYDIFRVGKFKQELEQEKAKNQRLMEAGQQLKAKYAALRKHLSVVERMEALGLHQAITKLRAQEQILQTNVDSLSNQTKALEVQIIQLDETILMQSFGIYETHYDLEE
jgi:chromosome segregation ATPase